MKIEWSESFSIEILKEVRDQRTKKIHHSVRMLLGALVLYVLMFVIDLISRFCECI